MIEEATRKVGRTGQRGRRSSGEEAEFSLKWKRHRSRGKETENATAGVVDSVGDGECTGMTTRDAGVQW